MILIIDNYDSFTYNLFQYFCEITNKEVKVFRNDDFQSVDEIRALKPEYLVISPGPGGPTDAGISIEAVRAFAGEIPILGVCLGHQVIGHAFGGTVDQARRIVHGKVEAIQIDGKGIFRNIPNPAKFTRYHSLAIMAGTVPSGFEISAKAPDGEIMGIRHKEHIIEGIQFHPESMASEYGKRLLKNFLVYKRESFDMKALLQQVILRRNMTFEQAESFMEEVTEGNLTDAQLAAFLVAITSKGASPEEIAGCASILKKKRTVVSVQKQGLLDTCGTGGSGLDTFNISSLSALVAASCGAIVAKHGNRAATSKSGSADFYGELGVPIYLNADQVAALIERQGFSFMFAPMFHQAMKYAGAVRREIQIKTIFNLIGPLSNPANAEYQLMGVFDHDLCLVVAKAAKLLGVKRVMVVHGSDGMDEITVTGPSTIVEIDENNVEKQYMLDPEELGLSLYPLEQLRGGTAQENAEIAKDLMNGHGNPAVETAVCLNSGAALYVAGIAETIKEGVTMAQDALGSGIVKVKLRSIIEEAERIQEGL
ncbi:MAG: bifunctional anthranilate synthase component II/anthranilate phosphoribosyltransferase [Spirochaetales bacterium]|nr:bifunctional anthranilate synthase component II/anthranilate phosphoribosyltransferase [Spirochaetales bacterium]